VKPEVPLTGAQLAALAALQDYDLSPVRSRLLREGLMPSTWVDDAMFEFRRYLGLRVLSDQPPAMLSKPVDDVWHTCLLFSRLYADLCQTVFGCFMHHDPATEPDPESEATWQAFVDAYRAAYGEPGRLWQIGHAQA
jgi:hypothetical protein